MMELSYDEQLLLLDRIVADGLTRLLTEARDNKYLEEPYGRTVEPTPLISEEEFVRAGGLQGSLADEPDFNFQYGFNPLQYLSKFITWSHPNSVEGRRQEKLKAMERLCARAAHANAQLDSSMVLREKLKQFSSGIYWGPFVSPIPYKEDPMRNLNDSTVRASTCSVIVMCKALKTGFVNLQLSKSEDFSSLEYTTARVVGYRQEHTVEEGEDPQQMSTVLLEDILPVKIVVEGLQWSTQYFVRVYLSDKDDSVPEVIPHGGSEDEYDHHSTTTEEVAAGVPSAVGPLEVPHAQVTRFWTLPSEEVVLPPPTEEGLAPAFTCTPLSLVCFGQQPSPSVSICPAVSSAATDAAAEGPVYSALLGDLFYVNPDQPQYSITPAGVSSYGPLCSASVSDNQISALYSRSPLFSSGSSAALLRNSCALLAPRDSSDSSRRHLNSEEVNHKQFRHDLRRYHKKYPPAGNSSQSGGKGGKPAAGKGSTSAASTTAAVVAPPAPTIKRLPLTDSLQSLMELFPVQFTEDYDPKVPSPAELAKIKDKKQLKALMEPVVLGTRMLYRSLMVGPDVQVIVLDMRGSPQEGASYLGREQAAWLTNQLMDSSSLWKVILCGYSCGLVGISEEAVTTSEAEEGNAVAGAAEEPLGKNEEEGQATSAVSASEAVDSGVPVAKTKQFKLQEPEEGEKKARHILLDEEVDEVYCRSKHSLPYVLASVQKKYHAPTSSSAAALAADKAGGELFLSSGIVVLSSGVCKVVQPGSALLVPHNANTSAPSPQEAISPSFVAAYSSLLGGPSPDYTPLGVSRSSSGGDAEEAASGIGAYCAEIGLGSITGSTGAAYFGFMAGFEAQTLFDARSAVVDADAGSTVGRLSLAADGALKVTIAATNSNSSTDGVLYELTLRTHLLDASSLEETEDGTSTVQENQ